MSKYPAPDYPQPQPQPQYGQPQQATYTTTTVVVHQDGCCGPSGKIKWVAGYNMLSGIVNLINGGILVAAAAPVVGLIFTKDIVSKFQTYYNVAGALTIISALLLIAMAILLIVGLTKRTAQFFTIWLGLTGVYLALYVSSTIYMIVFASQMSDYFILYGGGFPYFAVISAVIFLLIQSLCIVAVVKFKQHHL